MDLKEPLSYPELVNRLIDHNMSVKDRKDAEEFLQRVNYYRFTGYALQFRVAPHDSDYIDGTDFDNIRKIYEFDQELRDILRKWIEVLEVYFRTKISHSFGNDKCKQSPHDQHYYLKNYYNKAGAQEVFDSFKQQKFYYKDTLVMQHHQSKYGDKLPIWVITEMISFSNLSKLYSCMYDSNQDLIAQDTGTGRTVLKNNLHCLSVLRNKCAHAARLYNTDFKPSAQFPKKFLLRYPEVKNNSLFAYVFVALRRLPERKMRREFASEIRDIVSKYEEDIDLSLIGFPENYYSIMGKSI